MTISIRRGLCSNQTRWCHIPSCRSNDVSPTPFTNIYAHHPLSAIYDFQSMSDSPSQSTPSNHGNGPHGLESSSAFISSRPGGASSPGRMPRPSEGPPTPESSPPFQPSRKRTVSTFEEPQQGAGFEDPDNSGHSWESSGEPTYHVCLCQPDPKIPRPRNGKCTISCVSPQSILVWFVALHWAFRVQHRQRQALLY